MTNKTIVIIFLLIILLLPFISPLIDNHYYVSADFRIQIVRLWTMITNIAAGNPLAHWSDLIYNGYGSPMFLFYPPFYYYLLTILYKTGIDFFVCFQIINIAGFILSALAMFIFARNFFNLRTAFLISFLYATSSYHLYDIYRSGQFVEAFIWFYLPLLLHCIYKYFTTGNHKYYIYNSIVFFVFLITHHSSFVIIIIPSLIYILLLALYTKKKNILALVLLSLFTGICLSVYFTIPCFFEKESVLFGVKPDNDFHNNFIPLQKIFLFFLNSDNSNPLRMPQSLNLAAVILSCFSLLMISKKEKNRYIFLSFFIFFIFGLFFNLKLSTRVWESVKIIEYLETPGRFIFVMSFSTSILSGIVINRISNTIKAYLLIFMVIVLTFYQTKDHIKVYTIKDKPFIYLQQYFKNFDIENFNPKTIKQFKYYTSEDFLLLPVTFNAVKYNRPFSNRIESNGGIITNFIEKPFELFFYLKMKDTENILAHIPYFNGWSVYINNIKQDIIITGDGLISFRVTHGFHKIQIKFELTLLRKISIIISILSFIVLSIFTFIILQQNKKT